MPNAQTQTIEQLDRARQAVRDLGEGGTLLAYVPFPNPGDEHLAMVMTEIPAVGYAMFTYNASSDGLEFGYYACQSDLTMAEKKDLVYKRYVNRLESLCR